MLKIYIDGWKIDGQFVEVERMLHWSDQVLCNGAVVVWSEYNAEDGWQPTCYVREPFRPVFPIRLVWRYSQMEPSGDMPF